MFGSLNIIKLLQDITIYVTYQRGLLCRFESVCGWELNTELSRKTMCPANFCISVRRGALGQLAAFFLIDSFLSLC